MITCENLVAPAFVSILSTIEKGEPASGTWCLIDGIHVDLEPVHSFHRYGYRYTVARFEWDGETLFTYWKTPSEVR